MIYSVTVEHTRRRHLDDLKDRFKFHEFKGFVIFERPGLKPFLTWLFANFRVSIWSAATSDYVTFIADNVIRRSSKRKIEHMFTYDDCVVSQRVYGDGVLKDLRLLWDVYKLPMFTPANTLLIDDLKKNTTKTNRYNSVFVKKFVASRDTVDDRELSTVKETITDIKRHFRKVVGEQDKDKFHLVHW